MSIINKMTLTLLPAQYNKSHYLVKCCFTVTLMEPAEHYSLFNDLSPNQNLHDDIVRSLL